VAPDHIQTHTHTTVGRTPLDEGSARRRDLYLTTHNIHNRQKSMPPAGSKPVIPTSEWPRRPKPQTARPEGSARYIDNVACKAFIMSKHVAHMLTTCQLFTSQCYPTLKHTGFVKKLCIVPGQVTCASSHRRTLFPLTV